LKVDHHVRRIVRIVQARVIALKTWIVRFIHILMPVFDNIERSALGPRPYAQPDFIYLNVSARPGVQAIRAAIEQWFLHYPIAHRDELRARLRDEDNYQHRSAFFELFLHEMSTTC
jgi:hypothetical protein